MRYPLALAVVGLTATATACASPLTADERVPPLLLSVTGQAVFARDSLTAPAQVSRVVASWSRVEQWVIREDLLTVAGLIPFRGSGYVAEVTGRFRISGNRYADKILLFTTPNVPPVPAIKPGHTSVVPGTPFSSENFPWLGAVTLSTLGAVHRGAIAAVSARRRGGLPDVVRLTVTQAQRIASRDKLTTTVRMGTDVQVVEGTVLAQIPAPGGRRGRSLTLYVSTPVPQG